MLFRHAARLSETPAILSRAGGFMPPHRCCSGAARRDRATDES
ncbi:hypothetical protein SLI_1169 [Streptomyces lividans 1326]|uniref:Uncharacterized protein n=1 Tax=Streptomyces lividans 1326 TaxID=1200984 RepID=A0A7U9DL04_STRLI|nr:hypothetical protein SLI_1169 [Streptomyces lividans 1326]